MTYTGKLKQNRVETLVQLTLAMHLPVNCWDPCLRMIRGSYACRQSKIGDCCDAVTTGVLMPLKHGHSLTQYQVLSCSSWDGNQFLKIYWLH